MIELESLEEYNSRKLREHNNKGCTGVACPNCGDELKEESPGVLLLSYPARKPVKCFRCNYSTDIIA